MSRRLLFMLFALAGCNDGWGSKFTQTDQLYRAQREKIAPMVYLDAKPPKPIHVVGYFELTSPESKDEPTMQVFKAHAATTGRDLGCDVVVFADVMQSSVLAPDNDLLACGNCQESSAPHGSWPPSTKKFYCAKYDGAGEAPPAAQL